MKSVICVSVKPTLQRRGTRIQTGLPNIALIQTGSVGTPADTKDDGNYTIGVHRNSASGRMCRWFLSKCSQYKFRTCQENNMYTGNHSLLTNLSEIIIVNEHRPPRSIWRQIAAAFWTDFQEERKRVTHFWSIVGPQEYCFTVINADNTIHIQRNEKKLKLQSTNMMRLQPENIVTAASKFSASD
jgi:hypothetical protein